MRHRKPRMLKPQIISEGTLRPEDLIPAYLDVLEGLRLTREERKLVREVRTATERANGRESGYWSDPTGQCHNVAQCTVCGWRSEDYGEDRAAAKVAEAAHECDISKDPRLRIPGFVPKRDVYTATWRDRTDEDVDPSEDLNALADIIDVHCAPYCYFGSSEGDGACFGVRVAHESLEEDIRAGEVWKDPDDGSTMPKEARYRLVVSDHGNMSLYHRNGRVMWEVV